MLSYDLTAEEVWPVRLAGGDGEAVVVAPTKVLRIPKPPHALRGDEILGLRRGVHAQERIPFLAHD